MSTVGEIIRNSRGIFRNMLVFGSISSIPDKTTQKPCKQHEERPHGSFNYTSIACISQATRRLGLWPRRHLYFFLYEKVVRMDQLQPVPFSRLRENICETDATSWNTYARCYTKLERTNASPSAWLKGLSAEGRWLGSPSASLCSTGPPCQLAAAFLRCGSGGDCEWLAPLFPPESA